MTAEFAEDGGLFSSEPFLHTVAEVYFPGKPRAIENVRVGGRYYRVLMAGRHAVGRTRGFYFYYDPISSPASGLLSEVPYLQNVTHRVLPITEPPRPGRRLGLSVAPTIRFPAAQTFDEYLRERGQLRAKSGYRSLERLGRKLARERGEAVIQRDDRSAGVLETLSTLKSAQCRANGWEDVLRIPVTRRFFRALHSAGIMKFSTLRAGEQAVAVVAYLVHGPFAHVKAMAYDPAFAPYSPGTILLADLIGACHEWGVTEVHLGLGDLPNKRPWATHMRLFGPAGQRPLAERIRIGATRPLGRILESARKKRRGGREALDG